MTGAASLFNNAAQAAQYSLNRPRYPAELYQLITAAPTGRSLCVDIACGSGQAAVDLSAHFEAVIAMDGSDEQLVHAMQRPNITYQHSDAHHTSLPDHCADLVTVAQALHWLDHAKFYREVRRILKPGTGAFAAWTYSLPVILAAGEQQAGKPQELLLQLYQGVLGPFWDPRRRLVDRGYRGIEPLTGTDFDRVSRHELSQSRPQTVDELLGYLSSWSAYQTYMKQQPGAADPLVAFKVDLMAALGAQGQDSSATQLTMVTPISLILCTGPTA